MSYRSSTFCLFIGLCLTVALGCSEPIPLPLPPSPPPPPPAPAATFTLSGTIVETTSEGTKPAFGVQVAVTTSLRAVTNAEGQYSIAGVPFGNHVVQIPSVLHEPVTRAVRVENDTRLDAEVVRLAMFTLSGTVFEVIDEKRVPLSDVHVENSNIHSFATTDQEGEFKVPVHRGSCNVFIAKPGFITQLRVVSIDGDMRIEIQLVRQ